MTAWVIKGGRSGEYEQRMLDHGLIALGWDELPDISGFDRESLEILYRQVFPTATDGRVATHVGQLFAFAQTAGEGDLVVLPLKTRAAIAVGAIAGPYRYAREQGDDMPHHRPVTWHETDIPRTAFDQDLLYTFGSALTFCRAERNNAEQRIRRKLENPAGSGEGIVSVGAIPTAEDPTDQDVEQQARDQITSYIGRTFRGHELTRLVDGVLRAQTFVTRRFDSGPDGGVDIVAGSGPMGFDPPQICVQVKSSDSPAGVTIYRELKGAMHSFGAQQGLLVCWGGFKETVHREARTDFFRVRLWDSNSLLDAILAHYDRLDEEIRGELPLKRIWSVVLSDVNV